MKQVGGSGGQASIALATAFPKLHLIVQDLPEVITRAKAEFSKQTLDPVIANRVTFEPHNFFVPQPASSKGAAAFLLRQIFGNWTNSEGILILQNLIPSLRNESRLIIMGTVIPEPGTVALREEALERAKDLFMMVSMNGRERSLSQWKDLLSEADKRLRIKAVIKPTGSILSVLEVIFDDAEPN